ncbi:helix-turn-helix domain-containing protein [Halocynthiibacter namhaensis]|uniref:helix-turn-helix domain-containing protein n=1 Tax=Halocynthiibacter namhaensis TaxID=1290553 RepID=UPI000578F224|nr:helix-turn-helix transcriptional regulator [Halocynthiibacter namhaensis]
MSDIRTIFPNNLRKLCERAGSVTGIANELGINRAQFVRYMNGESSPRPEILEKICRYFGLDARILLEPLETLNQNEPRIERAFAESKMDLDVLIKDPAGLPDGFYKYWKVPFTFGGAIYVTLSYIKTVNGVRHIKTIDHRYFYRDKVVGKYAYPLRRCDGFLFSHPHGHSFLLTYGKNRTTIFGYLEHSHGFNSQLYVGYTAISNPQKQGVRRVSNIVFEKLDISWSEALAFARKEPNWAIEDVHPSIREYLENA